MSDSSKPTRKILVAVLLIIVPLVSCGGSGASLPTLVPTANPDPQSASATSGDPAAATNPAPETAAVDAESLQVQMVDELRDFDYDQQQVGVVDVEMSSGDEEL